MRITFYIFIFIYSNSTGQNLWEPIGNLNRFVYDLYADSINNKLYVGGDFRSFNNDTTVCIFSWNGNQSERVGCGMVWDCLFPININNGSAPIYSICKFQNEIYVAGDISIASNVTLNGLGRFDGSTWQNLGTGLKDVYNSQGRGFGLRVLNNELYVMGVFDSCGGVAANSIAKFDGQNWSDVHQFPRAYNDAYNFIFDAAIYKNELYVAGNFFGGPGSPNTNILKFDGTNWVPVGNGIQGSVSKLEVYKDELYAGGAFSRDVPGNPPGNSLVRWDGEQWRSVGGDLTYTDNPPMITDMIIYKDRLYVVGFLRYLGGVYAESIAFWDGTNWNSISPPGVFNNKIRAIAAFQDTIYIGGAFMNVYGDSSITFIAKWAGGDTILESGNTTSIYEVVKKNFSIYPNPTINIFNIQFNELFSGSIVITDISGRILKSESFNDKTQITLSLEPYSNGIYFVSVINQTKKFETVKLVKL